MRDIDVTLVVVKSFSHHLIIGIILTVRAQHTHWRALGGVLAVFHFCLSSISDSRP